MNDADTIADLQARLDYAQLRLSVALDGEALALAALAVARQQAAGPVTTLFIDDMDMDAANEPEPDAHLPVLPARALRHRHAPTGLLRGPWGRP